MFFHIVKAKRLKMRPWIRWMMAMLILAVFAGCSSPNWVGRDDENPIYRAPRELAGGAS